MRIVIAVLIVLVLGLQYRLWVGDGGMREVWRLREEVSSQQAENEKLKERNRTLVAEVQDLKQGKTAIEERARTDLGMIGGNESFYQVMSDQKRKQDAPSHPAPSHP
jgi:cell division protein FtsB